MLNDEAMAKVLISMVGNRDPYASCPQTGNLTEGSILTLYRNVDPDVVILLPSAVQLGTNTSDTQLNADNTKEALTALCPEVKVFVYPLDLPDPTDYQRLLHLMELTVRSILDKVQNVFGNKVAYHVNLSSGTPQMQACWLLLVNGGRLKAKVWQVVAPQWQQGIEPRCRVVETEFIEEQNKISRARNFFAHYYFRAARDELELLAAATYLPQRALIAEAMAKVCEAYHHWDLFQHEKAYLLLKAVVQKISNFSDLSPLNIKLSGQTETLKTILTNREQESEANLLDLFHNAQRRNKAQQYVDCLARFKRLYEGCQNYFLRHELKIDPTQKYRHQPQWVREIVQMQPDSYIGLSGWARVLEAKRKRFPVTDHLTKEILNFNQQRDKSIIAHGMGTVQDDDSQLAMQLAQKFIKDFFPNLEPDRYPFSDKAIKQIESIIFTAV